MQKVVFRNHIIEDIIYCGIEFHFQIVLIGSIKKYKSDTSILVTRVLFEIGHLLTLTLINFCTEVEF